MKLAWRCETCVLVHAFQLAQRTAFTAPCTTWRGNPGVFGINVAVTIPEIPCCIDMSYCSRYCSKRSQRNPCESDMSWESVWLLEETSGDSATRLQLHLCAELFITVYEQLLQSSARKLYSFQEKEVLSHIASMVLGSAGVGSWLKLQYISLEQEGIYPILLTYWEHITEIPGVCG